jgi:hypothetical protein
MFSEFANQDEEINLLFGLLNERVPEYGFQIVLDQCNNIILGEDLNLPRKIHELFYY